MELQFSEEQILLRNTIEKICIDNSDLKTLRDIEDTKKGFSDQFWTQLKNLGLTGINIPTKFGGSEMGLLDQVIVYEEFGRALSLSPHLISSVICSSLINKLGTSKQKKEILTEIASGELITSLAWLEEGSSFYKEGINLTLTKKSDKYYVTGKKHMVPYASQANKIIILFRDNSNIGAAIIDTDHPGLTFNYQENHAKTSLYEVIFKKVDIDKDNLMQKSNFWEIWEEIASLSQILIAAEASGGSERSLYIGRDYSLEREAFGQKIGSFQSIAHYLADGYVEVEANKLMTYQAAWSFDEKKDISSLSALSKLQACRSFREIAATTIQIYGGMGFTVEADPQLFFKRAKHLQNYMWDEPYLENQIENKFFNSLRGTL